MIPNFKLDDVNFNIDSGRYGGIVHLKYEPDNNGKNAITLFGNIVSDNTIYSPNAMFELIPVENKLKAVGIDDGKRINLSFIPLLTKKPKDFKFQIVGQYGSRGIFKTFDMSMKNIKVKTVLTINDRTYPINLTLGSRMLSDQFIISGVDNITNKRFSISVTPKIGIKMKYQISGMYGNKILTKRVIDSDIKILKEILNEIKDNIIM